MEDVHRTRSFPQIDRFRVRHRPVMAAWFANAHPPSPSRVVRRRTADRRHRHRAGASACSPCCSPRWPSSRRCQRRVALGRAERLFGGHPQRRACSPRTAQGGGNAGTAMPRDAPKLRPRRCVAKGVECRLTAALIQPVAQANFPTRGSLARQVICTLLCPSAVPVNLSRTCRGTGVFPSRTGQSRSHGRRYAVASVSSVRLIWSGHCRVTVASASRDDDSSHHRRRRKGHPRGRNRS